MLNSPCQEEVWGNIIIAVRVVNLETIVTCQPTVGLRNRALLGSWRLSASRPSTRCAAVSSPCRQCEPNRTVRCYTIDAMTSRNSIGIRFLRNMPRWRHPATGVEEYRVTFAFPLVAQHSSHLARCCGDASTIEGFIRGTGMSKKSVCKEQSYEQLLSGSLKKES
jgi:hypothetical protein